jgi:hypothetical protein
MRHGEVPAVPTHTMDPQETACKARETEGETGRATTAAAAASSKQSRAELSAAIAMYRAMDLAFWLPQAEAALAQVEGGS